MRPDASLERFDLEVIDVRPGGHRREVGVPVRGSPLQQGLEVSRSLFEPHPLTATDERGLQRGELGDRHIPVVHEHDRRGRLVDLVRDEVDDALEADREADGRRLLPEE